MNNLLLAKKKKAIDQYNQGDLDVAKKLIQLVCQKARRDAESWYVLGLICANKSEHEQAADAFEKVLKIGDNKYIRDASVNLGVALSSLKKYARSKNILEQVIERYPDEADAYINLVISCIKLKDNDKALEYAERAIEFAPEQAIAHQNYGAICSICEKYDLAETAFEEAIRLDRNVTEFYITYARMLGHTKKYSRAVDMFKTVLRMEPKEVRASVALVEYKIEQGMLADGLHDYRQLIKDGILKLEEATEYLLSMQYDYHSTPEFIFEAHQKWGEAYSRSVFEKRKFKSHEFEKHPNKISKDGHKADKLKIAYLSPDFRGHSVSYFMESILQFHNRDLFEIHCFVYLDFEDDTTKKLKSLADCWHDITLIDNLDLRDLIRSENIDIAVELSGHTSKSKLYALSEKVAPIQVTYLGYPSTTGMAEIDYRLVDQYTDPEGYNKYATEQLIRIPDSFLCYSNTDISVLPPIQNQNESDKVTTFCSFNNLSKVNERVVEVWSKVLHRVEHSRLLFKNKSFGDIGVRDRYLKLFESQGIDSSRLELVGKLKETKDHMQLYSHVDIALDTFPYNGTTTTCEAMWMGVPVVTLCGDRHSSRVGNSLLNAVGSPQWVAHSEEEFVDIAAKLASDKKGLQSIKSGLRKQMQGSVLCDGPGFTNKLETIYRDLYKKWCDEAA